MLKHLWFAGAERPATRCTSMSPWAGRSPSPTGWTSTCSGLIKGGSSSNPSRDSFLIQAFVSNLQCPDGCACYNPPADTCRGIARKVALGFLYTYVCLISSESDFHIANETRLLPRNEDDSPIKWADWKALARELLQVHERNPDVVHPRFLRAELRLSRINTIHRFTRLPPFHPYVRGRHNYSSLLHDNLAWMATAAVFLALVLTAMQVGLATERLQKDTTFQQASYGLTVFAILGPMCAFGLVVLGALFNLVNDLPLLIGRRRNRAVHETSGEVSYAAP
ncbi:hypothetical protein QC762_0075270 [Podospora pseudocomata]|uniref:Uncharacterized protein n=1 Tax=Podospora pseudocomata TaxID=2093779 RepID=A0ABR0GAI7_9PEZI|nr:hypothetical protein QC762_0075270 [Podospora pseudocomata]